MSGKPGRSGRPGLKKIMRAFERTVDKNLMDIAYALIEKAKQGNTEAAKTLLEYRFGKPRQSVDLDINLPNSAQIALLYRNALSDAEDEYKQLTEGVTEGEYKDV